MAPVEIDYVGQDSESQGPAIFGVGRTPLSMPPSPGQIAFEIRGQWRFRRDDLDAWIRQQVEQTKAERDDDGGDQ